MAAPRIAPSLRLARGDPFPPERQCDRLPSRDRWRSKRVSWLPMSATLKARLASIPTDRLVLRKDHGVQFARNDSGCFTQVLQTVEHELVIRRVSQPD